MFEKLRSLIKIILNAIFYINSECVAKLSNIYKDAVIFNTRKSLFYAHLSPSSVKMQPETQTSNPFGRFFY